MLKNIIFALFPLINGYEKCAKRIEPAIAPFVGRFKLTTLRKFQWQILLVITAVCLNILVLLTFCR